MSLKREASQRLVRFLILDCWMGFAWGMKNPLRFALEFVISLAFPW
jgi:hypothetical protein